LRALSKNPHKNMIRPVQVLEDQRYVIFIAEHVPDLTTIEDYMTTQRSTYSERKARQIVSSLLSALAHLHDKLGFLHMDIRLETLFVDATDDEVKLMTFDHVLPLGSKIVQYEPPEHLFFSSPERFTPGNLVVKPEIDIWSVGVLMYWLFYARLPFMSRNPDPEQNKQSVENKITECSYGKPPLTLILSSSSSSSSSSAAAAAAAHSGQQQQQPSSPGRTGLVLSREKLSPQAMSLMMSILVKDTVRRPSAASGVAHPWFKVSLANHFHVDGEGDEIFANVGWDEIDEGKKEGKEKESMGKGRKMGKLFGSKLGRLFHKK